MAWKSILKWLEIRKQACVNSNSTKRTTTTERTTGSNQPMADSQHEGEMVDPLLIPGAGGVGRAKSFTEASVNMTRAEVGPKRSFLSLFLSEQGQVHFLDVLEIKSVGLPYYSLGIQRYFIDNEINYGLIGH